ncbi:MAG TPA: asparagine synthase (glutamine-hydrolyzing) [Vicinamibacteria bacterium]|nr:asparagine synthase (glutamine-hydrolyzing) [Vicinamibacteria bacterium]
MCGIVGVCEPGLGARVDREVLVRATDRLRHRGPDGDGFYLRDNVGLGHRRLSIIDLAGGAQPMFNEDGTIAVVFNGEIYNYRELQGELEGLGHRFASSCDTEAIVHAYEQWGTDCLQRFVGMFAFAIWDDRRRCAFIARDRLGKKPLFYHAAGGRLVFASEMKALLEHPAVPRKVDLRALDDYLAYSYVPSDRSIFAGVSKLPPGHWMRWRDGSLETGRYWQVDFRPGPPLPEEEWQERVEQALRRAVRLRLRADVPLGIFLSGGIDSSAVAAIASQELGAAVNTFSIGFGQADYDELRFARLVADRYRTNHHELVVEDRDLSLLGDVAYHLDEPFGDPSALPTFMVCREARKHVTVCLSGDGGDEVFAGYTRYRRALQYGWVDRFPAALRRGLSGTLTQVLPREAWGRGFAERLGLAGVERYFAQLSEFTAGERRALLAPCGPELVTAGARRFEACLDQPAEDLVARLQLIDQQNYLPDDILVKVDRTSMQTSLEVRAPFLDHQLVDIANAAPTRVKMRGGRGKYLLRKLLAPHLPAPILSRRKMGFGVPIKHWFRGSMEPYARELLLSSDSRSPKYLSRAEMERTIEQHGRGMRDRSRQIWLLLMLEHWCRRYCM